MSIQEKLRTVFDDLAMSVSVHFINTLALLTVEGVMDISDNNGRHDSHLDIQREERDNIEPAPGPAIIVSLYFIVFYWHDQYSFCRT